MLKLSENPPLLFPNRPDLFDPPAEWWVAHTKARAEKAFAWDLVDRDIAYFLPMMLRTRFSGGRKRRVLLPLFTSYVFFCGDEFVRQSVLSTNRLCQVIEVRDQQTLRSELDSIHRLITSDASFELYPRLPIGSRCRVTAGPFEGTEGTLIGREKIAKVVLQVSILGQGVSMDIDSDLIEVQH